MPLDTTPESIDNLNKALENARKAQNEIKKDPDKFAQNFTQRQPEWKGGKWDPDVNNTVTSAINEKMGSLENQLWQYTQELGNKWIVIKDNSITLPNGRNFDLGQDKFSLQIVKHTNDIHINSGKNTLSIMNNGDATLDGKIVYQTEKPINQSTIEQWIDNKIKNDRNNLAQSILGPGVTIESVGTTDKIYGWKNEWLKPTGMHGVWFYFSDGQQLEFKPRSGENTISNEDLKLKLETLKKMLIAPSNDPNKVYWWNPKDPDRPKWK